MHTQTASLRPNSHTRSQSQSHALRPVPNRLPFARCPLPALATTNCRPEASAGKACRESALHRICNWNTQSKMQPSIVALGIGNLHKFVIMVFIRDERKACESPKQENGRRDAAFFLPFSWGVVAWCNVLIYQRCYLGFAACINITVPSPLASCANSRYALLPLYLTTASVSKSLEWTLYAIRRPRIVITVSCWYVVTSSQLLVLSLLPTP